MNPTNTTPAIECPKCNGTGTFRHLRHVQDGVCFVCNGAKVVDQATANRWLASQMKADRRASTGPVAPSQPTKTIALPGFGNVRISLVSPGKFYGLVSDEEAGALPMAFDVNAGRVSVVEVSNGLRARRAALEGALQAALRLA